ncbi:MAG: acyltransferase family protein [Myxococcales bacterium]|nr:acyltransferase family protein [Myxococcales bacterium]MCB9575744.1 acyltransferase family protein [Polyangiaceae bacterium]
MSALVLPEVEERLARLELPFNRDGLDPYGVSREHLGRIFSALYPFYRHYFRCTVHGAEHIPARGRAMLVGNHSGGYAIDGAMVIASCFFELDPPRLAQGMVEKFLMRMPFVAQWTSMAGQVTGLPEHAVRLLEDERLLMVFPEGARGTAKLYTERYSLVRFGTGFMRLALETRTPIVPVAFLGGGEAVPTVTNLERIGRLLNVPYVPVTPYLLPVPLPVHVELHYGEPMMLEGTGNEDDTEILQKVNDVKQRISDLIDRGRRSYEPT